MKIFTFIFLQLLLAVEVLLCQIDIKGYMDSRFFFTNTKDEFYFNNIKDNISIGNYNRVRVIFEANPSEETYLNLAIDYFTFHGDLREKIGIVDPREKPSFEKIEQILRVDRAYMEFHFGKMDFTAGMQKISWGKSMLWSPFDVFKRINVFEPGEERRGVNAVKVYVPISNVSRLEAVYLPENKISDSRAGTRFSTNIKEKDISFSLIRDRNDFSKKNIAGFEIKGEYKIGWWLENAFISEREYLTDKKQNYNKFILGIDYTFSLGNGLYTMAEYFRDTSGSHNKIYDYNLIFQRRRYTLARDYIFSMIQYKYSMFTTIQASAIFNLNDGDFIFIPGLRLNILTNVDVMFGINSFLGPEGGEFKPNRINDPMNLMGNSQFYIWTKVHF